MLGEVFICDFPFTSGFGSKIRPVLFLFDLQNDAIVCRITSVIRTGPLDLVLMDWLSAGLLKPSSARLDRIMTVEKSIFIRRLGILSSADLDSVRSLWNKHFIL
jgi:mRNA interferase MazF